MNKPAVLTLLILASDPLHAEVFRCQLADKTLYQATPCPEETVSQRTLAIEKTPPDEVAKTQQRLEAWKTDLAAREAAERAAQKERKEELAKEAELEALQRAAKAQEELAESSRQPIIIPQPVFVSPPFPFRRWPRDPHHDQSPKRHDRPDKPVNRQR